MGVDYGGQDADGDFVEMLGGSGGQGFGLAVLDENSELDDGADTMHTRTQENKADLGDSANLPALMEYDDIDSGKVAAVGDANVPSTGTTLQSILETTGEVDLGDVANGSPDQTSVASSNDGATGEQSLTSGPALQLEGDNLV